MGNLFAKCTLSPLDSCENICVNDIQVLLDKYKENENENEIQITILGGDGDTNNVTEFDATNLSIIKF